MERFNGLGIASSYMAINIYFARKSRTLQFVDTLSTYRAFNSSHKTLPFNDTLTDGWIHMA